MRKYQREIKKGMEALKARTPEFRLRSEFETEKILNKWRSVARKKQIQIVKDELDIPWQPYNIEQYMTPKRRTHALKVAWAWIKYLFALRKELRP